jgi:PPE-repeat protein
MTLDFSMLPPEVNSSRMYAGAGPASMVAAASAWKGVAAELRSTALSYGAVVSALTDEEWHGPASAAMAAAAMPYVEWMNTTAVQAEQSATQAEAAVAAYEAAFAATVPPAQIAANRAQLAALVATNLLGQNTPAIAATEAQYGEMWAQDAAAMYGYAGSSAVATRLTLFDPPQQSTDPAGLAAQSAAVGQATATSAGTGQATLSKLTSAVPNALQSLASPTSASSSTTGLGSVLGGWNPFAPGSASATTGLDGVLNALFGTNTAFGQTINANIWNTIFSSGFYMPGNFLGTAADFMTMGQQGAGAAAGAEGAAGAAEGAAGAAAGAGEGAAAGAAQAAGGLGAVGNSVAAGLGQAPLVGPLSVPPSWTGAAPPGPLSSTLGATPMVAPPPAMAAGMPGVPLGGMAGQGFGRNVPQYGFKPTFIARPPSAG